KATRGDVFLTIKTITSNGTINSTGLILKEASMDDKMACVSTFPVVLIFSPIMIKTIRVISIVGTVVIVIYLMCVNKSVPAMAGARLVVSLKGESLSPK